MTQHIWTQHLWLIDKSFDFVLQILIKSAFYWWSSSFCWVQLEGCWINFPLWLDYFIPFFFGCVCLITKRQIVVITLPATVWMSQPLTHSHNCTQESQISHSFLISPKYANSSSFNYELHQSMLQIQRQ